MFVKQRVAHTAAHARDLRHACIWSRNGAYGGTASRDDPTRSVIIDPGTKDRIDVHTVTCAPSNDAMQAAVAGYGGY